MKKFISILLCFMLITLSAAPCFASDSSNTSGGGALPPTSAELAMAKADYDPSVMERAKEISAADSKNRAATWYSLNMTYYGQELNMSCGPACTRMALKYLTGVNYPESTVRANTLYTSKGTTLGALTNHLKAKTDRYYINHYGSSQGYIMSAILVSIHDYKTPPIIGISEQPGWDFPFDFASPHFVVINKVTSDMSQVSILDPWAGYVNDLANKEYTLSATNLLKSYNSLSPCLGVAFQTSPQELIPASDQTANL